MKAYIMPYTALKQSPDIALSSSALTPTKTSGIACRYLRGLAGAFNERAENLMDELTKLADCKQEAKMLQLVSRVTLDVIAKVLEQNARPPCHS